MTDSDELLSKADALLARWRSATSGPPPPADYPVLTDIVEIPGDANDAQAPVIEIFSEPAPQMPEATVDAGPRATGDAPSAPVPDAEEQSGSASGDVNALEERIRARVLQAIEPHVGTFLEEPLRLRMEDLARRLAAELAQDARKDILNFLREAVQRAVSQELEAQRESREEAQRDRGR